MTCSERLRIETQDVHSETELLVVNKLKMLRSPGDYVKLLKLFYGFFIPVDQRIRELITRELLADIHERRNTHRIVSDLHSLGYDQPVSVSPLIPALNNQVQAFGALYVAEGSTLGGRVIVKMLRDNSYLGSCHDAVSFFTGYNGNTIAMWRKFQLHLDQRFRTRDEIDEVLLAARETFSNFGDWIKLN